MKTSNATATTTFDFALSSIAMAVKSAKVSMKEAQKNVDAICTTCVRCEA